MGAQPFAAQRRRETVVLLHSSASSSRQWDTLAERLRPAFEVHAIDLHGHGRQAPWTGEAPLGVHDDAALALPVIERAGGVHLVGHSYGGAIAMHLAATWPKGVRSLAVYEPVLFGLLAEHEPQSAAARQAFDLAERMRMLVRDGELHTAAEHFVDFWSGSRAWVRLGPERQQSIATRMPIVVGHFDALYCELLPPARLARLAMPTLCLTGERSPAAARRIGALLRALLPGARHETLQGAGHMGPVTHPAAVNDRLVQFLDAHDTRVPSRLAQRVAA